MFFIRLLFWLSVVILLLPAEDPPSNTKLVTDANTHVSAARVVDAAWTTVTDIRSICQRRPQVCKTGEAAFNIFLQKARHGAHLVYDLLSGSPESPPAPAADPQSRANRPAARPTPRSHRASVPKSLNTLHSSDLVPNWRGPTSDRAV